MDEHFGELFERYSRIPAPVFHPAPALPVPGRAEVALARSAVRTS
jgi:hypothetical protein